MATILYENNNHKCIMFSDLVKGAGVQSNQFLIINDGDAALLDPGGQLTYHPLLTSMLKYTLMDNLKYVIASHQDPDIIASLGMWFDFSKANVLCSELWIRFLPHLMSNKTMEGTRDTDINNRLVGIPDRGSVLPLGKEKIMVIPAHFLHSVGNFQFYDYASKILFSGDMGASIATADNEHPVENFREHIPFMESFHKRYMVSNKVCRLWVNMVRQLDIEMIVPQHGKHFSGKAMITEFLNWIENLNCGIDLVTDKNYQLPG